MAVTYILLRGSNMDNVNYNIDNIEKINSPYEDCLINDKEFLEDLHMEQKEQM